MSSDEGGGRGVVVSSSRAGELAKELGVALGMYSGMGGEQANATAGRSLEGVRDAALSALAALNTTAAVLDQVGAMFRQQQGEMAGAQPCMVVGWGSGLGPCMEMLTALLWQGLCHSGGS